MKAQLLVLGLTLAVTAPAYADTLVLKNGRRVQGDLVGIVGSDIEFVDRSGLLRRTVRIARDQIARIEFGDERRNDDADYGWNGREDRGNRERAGSDTAIPRGMRERQVTVVSSERWIDTGIQLREGQMFYFAATGEVRWGRNRKHGAAGEPNSPSNHLRPIPDRPAAALIGKIGDREDVFFIGADNGPFRARESGRLYLGINDDWLADNTGALRVNVSY
jgi:hypothetical protein